MSKLEAELEAERTGPPGSFVAQFLGTLTGADVEVAKRDLAALVAEHDRLYSSDEEAGFLISDMEGYGCGEHAEIDEVRQGASRLRDERDAALVEVQRYREALDRMGWVQCRCGSAVAHGEKCQVCGNEIEQQGVSAIAEQAGGEE